MNFEITKEELGTFEVQQYQGELEIVEDINALKSAIRDISHEPLLGFDTESKPSFKKGQQNKMALIQIASTNKVYLIRVSKMGFPKVLENFLNTYTGIIAGIGLTDDWREINRLNVTVRPKRVVDLNTLATQKGFLSIGAKKLCALCLGFTISKKQQISNWEADPLSKAQISYAATDAWICRAIYKKLKNI